MVYAFRTTVLEVISSGSFSLKLFHCFCSDPNDPNAAWIVADRDGYKRSDLQFSSYNLSITLSDGTNSATYPINLIVESRDYNPSSDGEKTVTMYNYARSSGAFGILPLGNVYVTDLDDWDLQYKKFALVSQSGRFFRLLEYDISLILINTLIYHCLTVIYFWYRFFSFSIEVCEKIIFCFLLKVGSQSAILSHTFLPSFIKISQILTKL